MMKMRYSLGFYVLLALLLPVSHSLATGSNAPVHTHYTYMLGHAGWLHYSINAIGWAFLWQLITPARTLTAWICAVLVSYLLPCFISSPPVLGWSVIIFWYWGFILAYLRRPARLRLLALVAVSFSLPGLAAAHHATMLLTGYLSRKLYNLWQQTER